MHMTIINAGAHLKDKVYKTGSGETCCDPNTREKETGGSKV